MKALELNETTRFEIDIDLQLLLATDKPSEDGKQLLAWLNSGGADPLPITLHGHVIGAAVQKRPPTVQPWSAASDGPATLYHVAIALIPTPEPVATSTPPV